MSPSHDTAFSPSRRGFLTTTAGVIGGTLFSADIVRAQSPARYRRVNVADPVLGPRMLASYKKAVRAMLALPPEDPRNWYRHAFIHAMDCPHGNWWFLPWHRGYLGWFEQTCRELSQDPEFALPYWDWTAQPALPEALFEDELDPNHQSYIGNAVDFENRFKGAVANAGYWSSPASGFSPRSQYGQLLSRMLRFPDDLWFDTIRNPLGGYFFDQPNTRGRTKQNRGLVGAVKDAVALKTLYPALGARDFTTFGSLKSSGHSVGTGSGILENQPHNLVHNCIGTKECDLENSQGFMVDMMSPIDPIFFLHHANIDRLWDVWTRKQKAIGLPTLPDGASLKTNLAEKDKSKDEKATDYYRWAREPFLFFIDAKGSPVAKTRTDDYEQIGYFNYDYQPGSGEDVVPSLSVGPALGLPAIRRFSATVTNRSIRADKPGSAAIQLPADVIASAGVGPKDSLVARIILNFPPAAHGPHTVVLNGAADGLSPGSPLFVGTLSMFGHHLMSGEFTFIVPISAPVSHLRANKLLLSGSAFDFVVTPVVKMGDLEHGHGNVGSEDSAVEVVSVTVESY